MFSHPWVKTERSVISFATPLDEHERSLATVPGAREVAYAILGCVNGRYYNMQRLTRVGLMRVIRLFLVDPVPDTHSLFFEDRPIWWPPAPPVSEI
jgi:hypothetical protein